MLVGLFPAYESFVNFHNTLHRGIEGVGCKRVANPLLHEPSGLLSHLEFLGEFAARDTFLPVCEHIDSHEPFFHPNVRILEDCARLHGELDFAFSTLVTLAVVVGVHLVVVAVWARWLAIPADQCEVVTCSLVSRELLDEFEDVAELEGVILGRGTHCSISFGGLYCNLRLAIDISCQKLKAIFGVFGVHLVVTYVSGTHTVRPFLSHLFWINSCDFTNRNATELRKGQSRLGFVLRDGCHVGGVPTLKLHVLMLKFEFKNNYSELKADFEKDTGLNADTKPEVYIQYYQARMLDRQTEAQYTIAAVLEAIRHISAKKGGLA